MFFSLLVPDWQVFEQFTHGQLLVIRKHGRDSLAVVVLVYRQTSNYRIMSVVSLLMIHAMIWGNIWVGSYGADQSYVNGVDHELYHAAGLLQCATFTLSWLKWD